LKTHLLKSKLVSLSEKKPGFEVKDGEMWWKRWGDVVEN
jgi:hypothetical protein